jgi:Uma2 family endonuclease
MQIVMATIMEQEMLTADTTPSVRTNYRKGLKPEKDLRPEKRTDLTIEEAERLAAGRLFELIDGRLVFKYPEVLPPEGTVPPEERNDLTIEEAEELAQGYSFELIDGRMAFKMADSKHSNSQTVLIGELYAYFKQNPIGKVLGEFSLRLWPESKHRLPTPDVAVFLNENLRKIKKYATRAPDLTIEVVSDDDTVSTVFAKARLYLEKGSRVVWIVFPTEKSVVVMTPTERRWESDTLTCPELLPGFSIKVEEILPWPAQKTPQTEEPIPAE